MAELEGCRAGLKGDQEAALAALEKGARPKYAAALQLLALGDTEKADQWSKEALKGREI